MMATTAGVKGQQPGGQGASRSMATSAAAPAPAPAPGSTQGGPPLDGQKKTSKTARPSSPSAAPTTGTISTTQAPVQKTWSAAPKPASRWGKGPPASILAGAQTAGKATAGTASAPSTAAKRQPGDEALRHPSDFEERLAYIMDLYAGEWIHLTTLEGKSYDGILMAATPKASERIDTTVTLAHARETGKQGEIGESKIANGSSAPSSEQASMQFDVKLVQEIRFPPKDPASQIALIKAAAVEPLAKKADGVNGSERKTAGGDSFRTDNDISGQSSLLSPLGAGRKLQKWTFDEGEASPESSMSPNKDAETFGSATPLSAAAVAAGNGAESRSSRKTQAWDQFSANESKFGLKTDYHEELYTTKLDRSRPDFAERARVAARLEREILSGSTDNQHVKEEREGADFVPSAQVDGKALDEESKYSEVVRPTRGTYILPAKRAALAAASAASPTGQIAPHEKPLAAASATTPTAADAKVLLGTDPAIVEAKAVVKPDRPENTLAPRLLGQYRAFVNGEKERLASRKHELTQKQRDGTIKDLIDFSRKFHLKTDMPEDLRGMLKEKEKDTTTKSAKEPTSQSAKDAPPKVSFAPPADVATPVEAPAKVEPAKETKASQSAREQAEPVVAGKALKADAKTFSFKPTAMAFVPGSRRPDMSPAVSSTGTLDSAIPPAAAPLHPFYGARVPIRPAAGEKQDFDIRSHFNLFKSQAIDGISVPDPRTVAPDYPTAAEAKSFRAQIQAAASMTFQRHPSNLGQGLGYMPGFPMRYPSYTGFPGIGPGGNGEDDLSNGPEGISPGSGLGPGPSNGMMLPAHMTGYNPTSNYRNGMPMTPGQYGGYMPGGLGYPTGSEHSSVGGGGGPPFSPGGGPMTSFAAPPTYMGGPGGYHPAGQFAPQQYGTMPPSYIRPTR